MGAALRLFPSLSPPSPVGFTRLVPHSPPGNLPPATTCLKLTRFQPLGRKKSVSYTNRSGYLQIIANVKYSGVMTKCRDCQGLRGGWWGGGVGGAPGPPHPCSEEGRRQSAAAAHSPFNGDSPFMNSFTTFTNRAPLGKTVPEGINTSPAPPTPTGRCKHPRQDAHTSRGTGSLLDVKPNVLPDCVPRANTTLSLPAS